MKLVIFNCNIFLMRILHKVDIVDSQGRQKMKLPVTWMLIYHVFSFTIIAGHSVLPPTKDSTNIQQNVSAGSLAVEVFCI